MNTRLFLLAGCLALPVPAWGQTLLDDYARATALVTYMTMYVGESLLACAAAKALTDAQADARYRSYRERNAAVLERADAWSRGAEARLKTQGEQAAAQQLSQQAAMVASAAASERIEKEMQAAPDKAALCKARMLAIEGGRYDIGGNAELRELLAR